MRFKGVLHLRVGWPHDARLVTVGKERDNGVLATTVTQLSPGAIITVGSTPGVVTTTSVTTVRELGGVSFYGAFQRFYKFPLTVSSRRDLIATISVPLITGITTGAWARGVD